MLLVILVLQIVLLIAVVVLLARQMGGVAPLDPRQAALPDQITGLVVRNGALDEAMRSGLAEIRRDMSAEAQLTRQTDTKMFSELRGEVQGSITRLGETLTGGLNSFRTDNKESAETLRSEVRRELEGIGERLDRFIRDAKADQLESKDSLYGKLNELKQSNAEHQEKIRGTVEENLTKLNSDNAAGLEKMRETVDEKLQKTLDTRLTQSFGQVTMHLGEVQKGLGEMKELATGVGDLKKVLSNVKSRGIVGEFQLGQQLEQMFSPEQYIKNARIKASTTESVEYALKFPNGEGPGGYTLLPIDAKFPKEDWERLEHAYEHGSAEEIALAGRAFERTIRGEADRICKKYIDPPTTLPHAIMFLPTENLYAEVVRRPGLQSEMQSNCRVTVAGPSTFMAILTSFQMGFHSLAIEKKGDEVWRVLSSTKNEFEKFGGMMDKVKRQVDTVQNTLGEMSGKTKTINRALKNVASIETGSPTPKLFGLEEVAGVMPLLAASEDEE